MPFAFVSNAGCRRIHVMVAVVSRALDGEPGWKHDARPVRPRPVIPGFHAHCAMPGLAEDQNWKSASRLVEGLAGSGRYDAVHPGKRGWAPNGRTSAMAVADIARRVEILKIM